MEVTLNLLRSEWHWILGGTFFLTMFLGLRDWYPIHSDREALHYIQWGLLIFYMAHVGARVPEPYRTALVVVLLPYAGICDWVSAMYYALTRTLPGE